MANPHRGELDIVLAGRNHTLRPSFQALSEMENALGQSLVWLLAGVPDQGLRLEAMVIIIAAATKAAGQALSPDDIRLALENTDISHTLRCLVTFLERGLGLEARS
jgi:hydroxypyruvate isomerase